MQDQPELRVGPMQSIEKQREHIGTQGRDNPELEATREQPIVLPRKIANLLRLLQYPACNDDNALADRGDVDLPARPLDQGHTEEVLELAQLNAEGGLCDMISFRGMAKMPQIGHCDQVAQLGERHGLPPLIASIDFFDFFDWTNQPVGAQSACSGRFSSRREDTIPKKTAAT